MVTGKRYEFGPAPQEALL